MTSEDEKYFIIEIDDEVSKIVYSRVFSVISDPVNEFHDVFLWIKKTVHALDVSGKKLYIIFRTDAESLRYKWKGLVLYVGDPPGVKYNGEPLFVSRSTVYRFIDMFMKLGIPVAPEDPRVDLSSILENINSTPAVIFSGPEKSNGVGLLEIYMPSEGIGNVVSRKRISRLARLLVQEFIDYYHVKTPVVNRYRLGTYCWDGKRYRDCEQFMKKWLKTVFDHYDMDRKGVKYTSLWKEYSMQLEAATIEPLHYEYLTVSFRNKILLWNNLLNGTPDEAFKDHTPEIFVKHYIPWNIDYEIVLKHLEDEYTPEKFKHLAKQYTPTLLEVFKSWTGIHWINLYEIIGYTLYPKYDLHKAVMLLGEGANGKSTFLGLLRRILGRENISSVSLQKLTSEKDRFSAAELHGKLANIYADLPKMHIKYTGKFKILTGEDVITADRKYRDPIEFINYAKLIFSANELPPVDDQTLAFWRRWLVIEFPNKFPKTPGFLDKLINTTRDEIPRLIALSVIAITHVLKRGTFTYEGTEKDYKEKWIRRTDPVYAFLQDITQTGKYTLDPGGYIDKDVFYQEFIEWLKEHGEEYPGPTPSKREFTIALEKHGIRSVIIHGKRYYKGIKYTGENLYLGP